MGYILDHLAARDQAEAAFSLLVRGSRCHPTHTQCCHDCKVRTHPSVDSCTLSLPQPHNPVHKL
jgi:hypothetical protein